MKNKKVKNEKYPVLVDIKKLKEHEEIDQKYLEKLTKRIKSDGILKKPIVADRKTFVVLDGVHRLNALKNIGCKKIPVIFVNYRSSSIKVLSWRKGEKISKEKVIKAGLSGEKLPPKTSKHMVKVGKKFKHISFLEKKVNILLKKLKI